MSPHSVAIAKQNPTPTVLTGIQPSGVPTLGNFLGFFKPALSFQATHKAYYFVVDHHAITARQDPAELRAGTREIAAWYLAAGLNPSKATLFVQSHVRAHTEMGWIMNTFTQMGELERMTQFKDKAKQHATNINVGLFTYPVLQAADILLYQATEVPVGEDQRQHVELCRDVAIRFNGIYGAKGQEILTVPKHSVPPYAARVRDLQDPTKKMSKSRPGLGCVLLTESAADVEKKFKRAVTDSDTGAAAIRYLPDEKPGVANLLEIIAACQGTTPTQTAATLAGENYGTLKQAAAEAVNGVLQPLQAAQADWVAHEAKLNEVLYAGAAQAEPVANATLASVKEAVGYWPAR